MKNITVIYHKDCPDGFSGAWVAWKKFGDKAEYIPIENRFEFPGVKNKKVYIIDLSFPETVLKEIKEKNSKLVVIDHHESGLSYIGKIADEYHYKENISACVIAWKYFFPKKPVPKFLKYVSDTDNWKFKMSHSEEILLVAELTGFSNFKKWDRLIREIEDKNKRKEHIKTGKSLLRYQNEIVGKIAEFAYEVEFEGMKVLAVNNGRVFRSQLGHLLAERKPPMSIIWWRGKERIGISLRSDGTIDVSEIAKKYGGGGHASAAGFTIPKGQEPPWKDL